MHISLYWMYMYVRELIIVGEWQMTVTCMVDRSAVSRQHVAAHRLHLHQLLTDDTTDLDSYEVSAIMHLFLLAGYKLDLCLCH